MPDLKELRTKLDDLTIKKAQAEALMAQLEADEADAMAKLKELDCDSLEGAQAEAAKLDEELEQLGRDLIEMEKAIRSSE